VEVCVGKNKIKIEEVYVMILLPSYNLKRIFVNCYSIALCVEGVIHMEW